MWIGLEHPIVFGCPFTRLLTPILSSNPRLSSHDGLICNILGHGILGIDVLHHSVLFRCSCTPHIVSLLHLLSNFRTGISATYFEDIGDLVQLAVCRDICSSAFHLILLHFKLSILEVYAFLGHMMHLSLSPYLYHQLRSGPVSAPAFLVVSVNDSSIALALCVAFCIFGMGIFRARRFKINALEFAFPVFVGFVADSSTISYLLMDGVVSLVLQSRPGLRHCILSHHCSLLYCVGFLLLLPERLVQRYAFIVGVLSDFLFGRLLVFWCLNVLRYTYVLWWDFFGCHCFNRKFVILIFFSWFWDRFWKALDLLFKFRSRSALIS